MITYTMPDINLIAMPVTEYERLKASRESLKQELLSEKMVDVVARKLEAWEGQHGVQSLPLAKAALQAVVGVL